MTQPLVAQFSHRSELRDGLLVVVETKTNMTVGQQVVVCFIDGTQVSATITAIDAVKLLPDGSHQVGLLLDTEARA